MSDSSNPELVAQPAEQPRVLGLDIGDRRIGVAITDALGMTAQPMFTLTRSKLRDDLKSLARIVRKHGIRDIVAGNPIHLSGDQSAQASKAQAFAAALGEETGITVQLWDERMTTTEAHRHLDAAGVKPTERKGVIDQVAAVLILESWLAARKAG